MSKVPVCLDKYGNTSSGSIPLTLSAEYGEAKDDSIINALMCGFGVGLSWGVISAKLSTADIFPVIETDDYFEEGYISSPNEI